MALSFRQSEILDMVRLEGRVMVDDLAQKFDVTLQTIRREVLELARPGLALFPLQGMPLHFQ